MFLKFCPGVYIDDILIFNKTEAEHEVHLREVLTILDRAGLRMCPKKCKFFKDEVEFLGYAVSQEGIKPLDERVKVLKELNIPKDKKELQRYLGMFGFYQRCIPNFSEKVKNLRS